MKAAEPGDVGPRVADFVDRAAAGEESVITDAGPPVAKLYVQPRTEIAGVCRGGRSSPARSRTRAIASPTDRPARSFVRQGSARQPARKRINADQREYGHSGLADAEGGAPADLSGGAHRHRHGYSTPAAGPRRVVEAL